MRGIDLSELKDQTVVSDSTFLDRNFVSRCCNFIPSIRAILCGVQCTAVHMMILVFSLHVCFVNLLLSYVICLSTYGDIFIFEKHVTICQYDYLFITNIVHPKLKTMGLQEEVFFF
jgi:hypothetical protein